ncbi:thermonuclease family protein [Magnetospirillum sp. UT-4]|uniref:thermonuclease family protein n=1 Tax=Magnetospirillum sp. UT-4 TaxID=2681467 RepID=UPI0015733DB5|nr:hypothetical protein [Magnetospirillum sp. UT-4]
MLLMIAALMAGQARSGDILPGPIPATVQKVVDGDTVHVRARIRLGQDVETMVRLAGIDTPEIRGRGGCPEERDLAAKVT